MSEKPHLTIRWRGQILGPWPLETVLEKLDRHEIGVWHEVQREDGSWTTLQQFLASLEKAAADKSLAERARAGQRAVPVEPVSGAAPERQPPPVPSHHPPVAPALPIGVPAQKSLKLFVGLALILGMTGAHNFYAGHRGTAIAQTLLTAATLYLGFGFIVSWAWAITEIFIVHSDARGIRMV